MAWLRARAVPSSPWPLGCTSVGHDVQEILCATDFSTGSQQALSVATSLAARDGSELAIVHAWYMPPAAYPVESVFPPEVTGGIIDDAQAQLDVALNVAQANGAKRVTARLLRGTPWVAIVRCSTPKRLTFA